MPTYKEGKWAKQILAQRQEDGLWGTFHTLSQPVPGRSYTTEQAIRRLLFLGYTAQDEVLGTVVKRMEQCIRGERPIDNYSEKKHDWPLFEQLMLGAWLRILDPQNEAGLTVARQWARIAEQAFAGGRYSREDDAAAFLQWKGRRPKSEFETGFGMFYHAALLAGVLPPRTEDRFLDHCLSRPGGMFYIYDGPLDRPPQEFASRAASRYLAAIEVLSRYDRARDKLAFAADWLCANRDENGQWDFGEKAKDGIYFPLSDRWDKAARLADSTHRVARVLTALGRKMEYCLSPGSGRHS